MTDRWRRTGRVGDGSFVLPIFSLRHHRHQGVDRGDGRARLNGDGPWTTPSRRWTVGGSTGVPWGRPVDGRTAGLDAGSPALARPTSRGGARGPQGRGV